MPRKGTKRRKTRTHVKSADSADPNAPKTPKSFVVKSGVVGHSVSALTRDVRQVLEPNTASRLRERKSNRLRDFVSMSGPLGVTHVMVFSQPSAPRLVANPALTQEKNKDESPETRADRALVDGTSSLNLRLIRLPRGPTLSFKVLRYSLAADVLRMARRPRSVGREFAESPMLILSGFGGDNKELKLMTTVFQNLFPPIHVQTMALSSARRVVLLSYNATTHTIDFRHFLISVRQVGVSRPIRKLIAGSTANKGGNQALKRARDALSDVSSEDDAPVASSSGRTAGKAKGVLDLGRADDISDYILRHGDMGFVTSDSEQSDMSDAASSHASDDSEADERRGKVRLAADYVGRGNRGKSVRGEKRAVRLVELGPRMELGLVKIEEGVGEGEVLFHEMVHKSVKEAAKLAKVHAEKRKLQAERRAEQLENVRRKKEEKKAREAAANGEAPEEDEEEDEDKIDSDNSFDYDEQHGLPVPDSGDEDSEEFDDDSDEEDEDEDEEMDDEDDYEGEVDENGLRQPVWNGEEDDSDLEPISLSNAVEVGPATGDYSDEDEEEDESEEEDLRNVKLPPRKGGNKPSSTATGFSQRGFAKQDRGEGKRPAGIARERGPTKKQAKREQEKERKSGSKDEWKGRYEAGDKDAQKEKRGGGGDRGGRGGGRGGARGGGRGGRGGSRGGRK